MIISYCNKLADASLRELREFLDLWKDSDHGIVEAKNARKRFAGLKAN